MNNSNYKQVINLTVNVSFDMSSLGTNGKYTCWGESVLTVPLVLRLDSAAPLTPETSNAFALSSSKNSL